MAEKMKETAKKVGKSAIEAITVDRLVSILGDEKGQEALKKLYGKVFNIGPNDEAILDNAVNEISQNLEERAEIRKRVESFLSEMKKNNYSTEWFKAVLVKKNRDWKTGTKGKSPVAQTIEVILEGKDFNEKVEIATSELMRKTVVSKIKEGWQVVVDKNGKMNLLVNFSKLKNKSSGIIEKAQDDFKGGFWGGLKTAGIISFIFVVFITIAFSLFLF